MTSAAPRWIAIAAYVMFGVFTALAQTPDSNKLWTTVGSTGTVDASDVGKIFFDHGIVQKGHIPINSPSVAPKPALAAPVGQTTSAVVRYNVTAVDGLFTGDNPVLHMQVRFLDEGGGARVVAKLIEMDITTGRETTRLTFDSNATGVPVLKGYHVHQVGSCSSSPPFDFVLKAYYIEATLTTSSVIVASAAGIQMIQLDTRGCIF